MPKFFPLVFGQLAILLVALYFAACRPAPLAPDGYVDVETQGCVLTGDRVEYRLLPCVEVLPSSLSGLDLPGVLAKAAQDSFVRLEDSGKPIQTHRDYWWRVTLTNELDEAAAHREWVLLLSSTWSHLQVYVRDSDGDWTAHDNGAFTPVHRKAFSPTASGNLFKLDLPPGQPVEVYLYGRSERQAIRPNFYTRLQHADAYYAGLVRDKVGNALFSGLLLMLLVYNLMAYFLGRDRVFVYYSGYLLMLLLYAGFNSEDLADLVGQYWFPESPQYMRYFKLSLYGAMMFYLAFVQRFLDLPRNLPRWGRWYRYAIMLGAVLAAANLVVLQTSNFSFVIEDRISVPYILVVTGLLVAMLPAVYRLGDRKGYFIIGGVLMLCLGAVATVLTRTVSPPFTIVYLKAGIVAEALVFSLGLAFRQQQLKRDEQRARFYANVTHEFRTPLSVILGITEGLDIPARQKDILRRNGQALLSLVNRLLSVSQLGTTGAQATDQRRYDAVHYLRMLTESFESRAHARQIKLLFYTEVDKLPVGLDEERLRQIVYNLVSNALKFTLAGGQVVVHLSEGDQVSRSELCLRVKDNGIGIDPEELPHVFDRFYRVGSAEGSGEDVGGLGLNVSREVARELGGDLTAESRPGRGSCFTVTLPLAHRPRGVGLYSRNVSLSPKPVAAFAKTAHPPQRAVASAVTVDPDAPTLLIIEDHVDLARYTATAFDDAYEVRHAVDGEEGLRLAAELVPDAIICDVVLPGIDGYDICEALKRDERTSHIPVVMLTGRSARSDRLKGLRRGADAYLTKPFDKEELRVRVGELVKLRQRLHARFAATALAEPDPEDAFISRLQNLIEQHLDDAEFKNSHLAELADMTPTQLYRKVKALTGSSPSQFVRAYRLRRAVELLRAGHLNISETAYTVGFNDPSYFSRVFQQKYGSSPSDYLRSRAAPNDPSSIASASS